MSLLDNVTKRLSDLIGVEDYDEWLTMSSLTPAPNSIDNSYQSPHIRLKMKYKHDIILPLRDYHDLQTVRMRQYSFPKTGHFEYEVGLLVAADSSVLILGIEQLFPYKL